MADLVITAASVLPGTGVGVTGGTAGATITAGQAVYKDGTGLFQLALADTAPHAAAVGIALNGAAVNQPISVLQSGPITIGATVVAGGVYCVSSAIAGNIAPVADIVAGKFNTILGIATSTTVIQVNINQSGIAHG